MAPHPRTADIFCTVVDNFGDISIAWALARELTRTHDIAVQIFVDNLEALKTLVPQTDTTRDRQTIEGVQVLRWGSDFPPYILPADLVVEVLAAKAPESYLRSAAARSPAPPVWLLYEYLSAEDWVEGAHVKPSPHPSTGLPRYFFCPGFTPKTGGLLYPSRLPATRDVFQNDATAQNDFWHSIGIPARTDAFEIRLSLFGYENASLPSLLAALAARAHPVRVIAPHSRLTPDIHRFTGAPDAQTITRGPLTLHHIPFIPRDRFDHLLWSCDLNFVRGEESLTSAVMAARPLMWQIYPQDDGVHLAKLAAFCALYSPDPRVNTAMQAWNTNADMTAHIDFLLNNINDLKETAQNFAQTIARTGSAADNMVDFCRKKG